MLFNPIYISIEHHTFWFSFKYSVIRGFKLTHFQYVGRNWHFDHDSRYDLHFYDFIFISIQTWVWERERQK